MHDGVEAVLAWVPLGPVGHEFQKPTTESYVSLLFLDVGRASGA